MHTRPGLLPLARFWFKTGLTSWGGMYAMVPKLQAELESLGWLPRERFQEALAAATLVPGPSFLSLGGLIGYQLGGYLGAAVSLLSLMLPPTILVVFAMLWISPEMLSGPLAPVARGMTVAVAGVLIGNAYKLAAKAPRRAWRGPLLLVVTTGSILAGVPIAIAVVGGVLLGALLLRENKA